VISDALAVFDALVAPVGFACGVLVARRGRYKHQHIYDDGTFYFNPPRAKKVDDAERTLLLYNSEEQHLKDLELGFTVITKTCTTCQAVKTMTVAGNAVPPTKNRYLLEES
jgi:hypothetical protein